MLNLKLEIYLYLFFSAGMSNDEIETVSLRIDRDLLLYKKEYSKEDISSLKELTKKVKDKFYNVFNSYRDANNKII